MDSQDISALFNFFKIFDDEDSYFDLKKEIVIETCDEFHSFVKGFDFQTGEVQIEWFDFETSQKGITSYNATSEMLILINKYTRQIKNEIDVLAFNAVKNGQDLNLYLLNFDRILTALAKREYKPFDSSDVLYKAFADIANHLKKNYDFKSDYNFGSWNFDIKIEDFNPLSFKWLSLDSSTGYESLKKLFRELSKDEMIKCHESDFINAFTQSKIDNGIKWCVTGKDPRYSSKQTLMAFVDYLIAEKMIAPPKHYNQSIQYIFRDFNGNTLKNLSQSKSNSSKTPTDWEKVKSILDKL